jgi:hypothetical protein
MIMILSLLTFFVTLAGLRWIFPAWQAEYVILLSIVFMIVVMVGLFQAIERCKKNTKRVETLEKLANLNYKDPSLFNPRSCQTIREKMKVSPEFIQKMGKVWRSRREWQPYLQDDFELLNISNNITMWAMSRPKYGLDEPDHELQDWVCNNRHFCGRITRVFVDARWSSQGMAYEIEFGTPNGKKYHKHGGSVTREIVIYPDSTLLTLDDYRMELDKLNLKRS